MAEKEYVLGTDQEELARLDLQHRCWRAAAYDHWERAGFAPEHSLLDVGCGPGFATIDLARLVGPTGRVTGVDVSRRFLDHLTGVLAREKLSNVTLVEDDVQRLGVEAGGYDGAWCRWVLSFVKDPEAVVAGVARALRPGGAFALQEYVSYSSMKLGPRGRTLPKVVAAIEASWRAQGGDPDVALRLPAILERQGLIVSDVRPICRIARPGGVLWEWPASFFVSFVPRLVESGYLSAEDAKSFKEEWQEHALDPDTVFLAPTVLEITATRSA